MNRRLLKINKLIQKELSKIIQDKYLEKIGLTTINTVIISADLSEAKIWLGIIDKNPQKIVKLLTNHEPELHWQLGKLLNIKTIPRLKFYFDQSTDKLIRMEKLINNISHE